MYVYNQNYNSFFGSELDIVEINNEKKSKRLTNEEFIKRANNVHDNRFDYSECVYMNMSTKISVICKRHNVKFTQTPANHLHGSVGCPICNKNIRPRIVRKIWIKRVVEKIEKIGSVGEKLIECWLNKNSINYEKQKTFDGCKNYRKLRYDFYLPEQNILIEYDGRQHFSSVKCFGGESEFIKQLINDKIKTEYALNNGYYLLRIPYTERKNLLEILKNNIEN